MSSINKHTKSILIASLATLAFASGQALADTGSAQVTNATPKPIVVVSNGTEYTQVNGGELNISGKLIYDGGTAGRVKSWEVWPEITTGFGIHQQVANTKTFGKLSQSYGLGNRPKTLNQNVNIKLNMSLVSSYALSMCNLQAASLRDQGMSNAQIFGQDRSVHFNVTLGRNVDASGAGSNKAIWEYSPPYKMPVTCARHQGASLPTPGTIQSTPKPTPGYGQKTQAPNSPNRSSGSR